MSPVVEVQQEVTFFSVWPRRRWRGGGECEQWSAALLAGLALLMGKETSAVLSVACHSAPLSIMSVVHLLASPLIAALCPLTLEWACKNTLKMRMNEVWKDVQPVFLFACTSVCVHLLHACVAWLLSCSDLFSAAMSRYRAKRPSGESSSTRCWAPQGVDWTLPAGVLSIQPLQATLETRDGATVLLCLLSLLLSISARVNSWFDRGLWQPVLHLCLSLFRFFFPYSTSKVTVNSLSLCSLTALFPRSVLTHSCAETCCAALVRSICSDWCQCHSSVFYFLITTCCLLLLRYSLTALSENQGLG